MINIVRASYLEKSVKSIFIIAIILLFRQILNVKSVKRANMILWSILFIYLIFPYLLLIKVVDFNQYGVLRYILEPIMFVSKYVRLLLIEIGSFLNRINRLCVSILLLTYVVVRVIKMNKAMKNSTQLVNDARVEKALNLFKFKRKVSILINDKIKVPITYGVINPKIIIQSHILEDDELLKFVLIHELTHVKKFDIVFKHMIICQIKCNIHINTHQITLEVFYS